MTKLGYLYFLGNKVEKDQTKARDLYVRAAKKGNNWAKNNLCNIYLYGYGVEVNMLKAWAYCLEPARAGNPSSMVMLAEMAESEELKPSFKTEKKAIDLAFMMYEAAAKRGHMHGQFKLAQFYEQGKGTPQSITKAKVWYLKSYKQGHEEAKAELQRLGILLQSD